MTNGGRRPAPSYPPVAGAKRCLPCRRALARGTTRLRPTVPSRIASPGRKPPSAGMRPLRERPVRSYCAVIAPSATSTVPVTNDDSSEARNRATLAISRGSPGRPIGWNESIVA